MSLLTEFASRNLAGKILLLDEIDQKNRTEAIPDLFALHAAADLDGAVRGAVGDTLRSLLARSEAMTVEGLASPELEVRRLCLQVATAHRFPSAFPALARLADTEDSPEIVVQVLSALAAIDAPSALGHFRRFATHDDPFVAALALEGLGLCKDSESFGLLERLVAEAEADDRYQVCAVTTEKAVVALGALGTDDALRSLTAKIHHRNPTARRFIHEEIQRFGSRAVPALAEAFEKGDVDQRILAANLFGAVGDRRGADILVSALDRGLAGHPNIRFAIFEALGQIPTLKGVVCLLDALDDDDEMTLLAVATSLDHQLNPGVVGRVLGALKADPPKRARFLKAVVEGRALNLFDCLYGDAELSAAALEAVQQSRDPETLAFFRERLLGRGTDQARADAGRLASAAATAGAQRLLVVDDSKSMLLFYRGVASAAGLQVATAGNGKEAADLLDGGEAFDLIITDLNMPVMDGIEFTRRVRASLFFAETPVLMATTESEGSQKALASAVGVTGFLQKPLKPDVLTEAIRKHLPLP